MLVSAWHIYFFDVLLGREHNMPDAVELSKQLEDLYTSFHSKVAILIQQNPHGNSQQ